MPVLEFPPLLGRKTALVRACRAGPLATKPGGRRASVACFRDISERVEARLAVERLEERLATLQDDERRRIAQELHDSTAQHLVAAKFNLLSVRKQVPEEVRSSSTRRYRSLREATAEIRTFTYLLHASQLDEEGICAMLRAMCPASSAGPEWSPS
jgi:signal transduction histidine kinase